MPLSQVLQVEEAARRVSKRLPDMRVQESILCRVAVILGRDLTSRLDQLLAPAGLAELEFRLLLNLFARGGTAFPGELCPALAQSPANLTRISDLMVERGLITRTPDPEDRRKLAMSLTPAGEQLTKDLAPQLTSYMTRLYRDFTEAERIQLMDFLKRLVGALDVLSTEDSTARGRRPMIRRAAAFSFATTMVALLGLTSGCESLHAPDEPVTNERQFAPLQNATTMPATDSQWPDATWWRGYGDDTLNSLIETALRDSPGLATATARFATASQNARVAGAQAGLQVDASFAYELYRLSDNGLIPPEFLGYHSVNQSDLGIGARYTMDWWGKNRSLIEAATDQARASEAEELGVALTLASSIAQSYFAWQVDGARIALLDEQLATLQQAALIAQHRESAGLDRSDEGDRNRREQALVRELRTQLQGAQQVRVIELAALLGISPDQVVAQLQARALPQPRAGLPANASIDLMAHRPDIVASKWRVEAARKNVASIRAEYYPDITLHALAGLSSVDFAKLLDPGSWAPALGFAVHLPLFDAGLRGARHDESTAHLMAAVASYNQAIVDAAREVGTAVAALQQSAAQRRARAEVLAAADSLLRSAHTRQQSGVTDIRPELDARISLQREKDVSLQIEYANLVADIQLQAALGGGLHTTENSP